MDVNSRNGSRKCPRVVIIGSGLAGLAAAQTLVNRKPCLDVTVLEANNRIGGRVLTLRTPENDGKPIELGAQWFHGIVDNPLYQIAKESGITVQKSCDDCSYFAENGSSVDQAIASEADDYFSSLMQQIYKRDLGNVPDDIQDLGHFINSELEKYLNKIKEVEVRAVIRKVFAYRIMEENHISGCSTLHDLHLRDFGEYIELEGADHVVMDGYDCVLQKILDHIPQDIIQLNEKVVKIIQAPTDDKLKYSHANDSPAPVTIECSTGNIFKADFVICTISLGVLKEQARHLFQPALPARKLDVIDRLAYGIVNKVVFCYNKPFWSEDDNSGNFVFLWNEQSYDKTNSQRIPKENDSTWIRNISSGHILSSCPNALLFWFVGDDAIRMEKLKDEQLSTYITGALRTFLNNNCILEPDSIVRTKWYDNPYFRGSYCYVNVNSKGEDLDVLAEPVLDQFGRPSILFAGEATHRSFYSTAHGAYLSGQREAIRILNILNKS